MSEFKLVPHPDFPSTVRSITVTVASSGEKLILTYKIDGDLDQLHWPSPAAAARTDELWQHTCLEIFIGHPAAGYAEYNFSPSGQWASYLFDGYRQGMRPATELPEPKVQSRAGVVSAEIDLRQHRADGAASFALSAVIEEKDGRKSYWALAHAPGAPDFHNAAGFVAQLPPAAVKPAASPPKNQ